MRTDEITDPLTLVRRESQVVACRSRVYGHLLALTRDPALADDLTQETLVRALARLDQVRDHRALLGWLYRIATNIAVDHARGAGRDSPADVDQIAETGSAQPLWRASAPMPQAALERLEMTACVDRQLAALSDDHRAAVLLHDGYGMTNPEIAAVLGCSVATVKIRVHRGRTQLRGALTTVCDFDADDRGELVCQPR